MEEKYGNVIINIRQDCINLTRFASISEEQIQQRERVLRGRCGISHNIQNLI